MSEQMKDEKFEAQVITDEVRRLSVKLDQSSMNVNNSVAMLNSTQYQLQNTAQNLHVIVDRLEQRERETQQNLNYAHDRLNSKDKHALDALQQFESLIPAFEPKDEDDRESGWIVFMTKEQLETLKAAVMKVSDTRDV